MAKALQNKMKKKAATEKLFKIALGSKKLKDSGYTIKNADQIGSTFRKINALNEAKESGIEFVGFSESNSHKATACTKKRSTNYSVAKTPKAKLPSDIGKLPRKLKKSMTLALAN